jgi:pSer/pThr/pTyr-binding forkhead associated (FHA) protein
MSSEEPRTILQPGAPRPAFSVQLGTKAFLVVVSRRQFGLLCVIGTSAVTLGRGSACRIRLNDPAASREHCRVSARADAGHVIEDCGSTNGTIVNGRRIEGPVDLRYGDRINIGSTIVRYYIEEIPDRTPG